LRPMMAKWRAMAKVGRGGQGFAFRRRCARDEQGV